MFPVLKHFKIYYIFSLFIYPLDICFKKKMLAVF